MEALNIEEPIQQNLNLRRLRVFIRWVRRYCEKHYLVIVPIGILIGILILTVCLLRSNVCQSSICNETADKIRENMKTTVDPCDDFYRFACEKYLDNTVIQSSKTHISPMSKLTDMADLDLLFILEKAAGRKDPTKYVKLIRTFYTACKDVHSIHATGLTKIMEIVTLLGGWPVVEGSTWKPTHKWYELAGKLREIGYPIIYMFGVGVSVDMKNSSQYQIRLDQPVLGLQRNTLAQGRSNKFIIDYLVYMTKVAAIFGATNSTEELEHSLHFEIELAKISRPRPSPYNYNEAYNPMTIKELQQKYPIIEDWKAHLESILGTGDTLQENEIVMVPVPSYFEGLTKLLKRIPDPRIIHNFLIWRTIQDSIPYLTANLRLAKQEFEIKSSSEIRLRKEHRMDCIQSTVSSLKIAVNALYVRRHFDEASRKTAVKIVEDVKLTMTNILKSVSWMDEETKTVALQKLQNLAYNVGHPDEMLNDNSIAEYYKELELPTSSDYLSLALLCLKFQIDHTYIKLRKPVLGTNDWTLYNTATTANGYYRASSNTLDIPVAILQGVFFDNGRARYLNYGAIGSIIGHEIGHSFDYEGRQFDMNRNLVNWWRNKSTVEELNKRIQCFVDQYSSYKMEGVDFTPNGTHSLQENIADNIGAKVAYLAYKDIASKKAVETLLKGLEKYTLEQMFWIANANQWCVKYSMEGLRYKFQNDTHLPSNLRVNGWLKNSEEFAKDFNCPTDSPMNPSKKCVLF